jgi:putative oxidoreductase
MTTPSPSDVNKPGQSLSYGSQARSKTLHAWYLKYVCLSSHLQSFFLLFLRLTIGWQLAKAGYGHLTRVDTMVEFFRELGIPMPLVNVYISGCTELIGGILLILGLGARVVAVPVLFNFIVAYATASRDILVHVVTGPNRLDAYDKFFRDDAFPMIVLSLAMLAFGAGKVSLDQLIKYIVEKREVQRTRLLAGETGSQVNPQG